MTKRFNISNVNIFSIFLLLTSMHTKSSKMGDCHRPSAMHVGGAVRRRLLTAVGSYKRKNRRGRPSIRAPVRIRALSPPPHSLPTAHTTKMTIHITH